MGQSLPRNVWILTLIQPFYMASASLVVLIGGLLGAQLAPQPTLATLPIAIMVIGTACAAIPAALLMQRFGRKVGLAIGLGTGIVGALVSMAAAWHGSFGLLLLGTGLLGSATAFAQQIRFAALEAIAESSQMASVVRLLTLSSLGAAFLGPEIAVLGQNWLTSVHGFSGSFLMLAGLFVIALVGLMFFTDTHKQEAKQLDTGRHLKQIVMNPTFLIALAAAAIGFGIMSFIMTATPVSMHDLSHLELPDIKWVIQSHIVAMFLPGLFTGKLIERFGHSNIILFGIGIFAVAIGVTLYDHQLLHYWLGLVLVGIGWNFLFFGGTTLLQDSYAPSERFKAQAFNDFTIFTIQAVVSLSAGVVVFQYGWQVLVLLPLPIMVLLFIAVVAYRRSIKISN